MMGTSFLNSDGHLMHNENKRACLCWLGMAVMLASTSMSHAGALEHAIDTQVQTDKAAQQSQKNVDSLSEQTSEMLLEYRDILRQTDSLRAYNDQLDKLVNSQQLELESITLQLENIETTQRDIVPLMLNMITVIDQFVELDIPFLPDERSTRLAELNSMMERADVTIAEKYRRILEAYQVETEYGRTIEAYQGDLTLADSTRTVDFLRIGRVNLYYLTLDSQEVGMWDADAKQWITLEGTYRQPVSHGLDVARKQLPPDLLTLPVKALGAAQ
jgi:hypothetical protein